MQSGQQEHLQKLIETSPILSPSEKAEWLDMLILMNDKQAGELEQILNARHASGSGAASVPAAPVGNIPPLSHISNLPSGLGSAAPAPLPRSMPADVPSGQAAWQKQFETAVKEKELPAGRPLPDPAARRSATPQPIQPPRPRPVPATPLPTAPRPTSPAAASTAAPAVLETLANIGTLTLEAMRSMNPADLLIRLQQLSKMEGYFNVLSYLEDSLLYKSYLATGKQALINASSFGPMTKKEFETFTDILRKIQLN